MREPRYPLPRVVKLTILQDRVVRLSRLSGQTHAALQKHCSLAPTAPGFCSLPPPAARQGGGSQGAPRRREAGDNVAPPAPIGCVNRFTVIRSGLNNDPSAGSPTETLLRLLLPLNDKVQWTSRDVTGGEPPPSPRSEHFTGPFNR